MNATVDDITCKELVELVSAYVDGSLAAGDHSRFDAHLEICAPCHTYVEQIRATIAAAGGLDEESLDPGAREALMTTFRDWKRVQGM